MNFTSTQIVIPVVIRNKKGLMSTYRLKTKSIFI